MSLTLTNIPKIMKSQKWYKAALLSESWFKRKAAIAPSYGTPDTTTLSIDKWALTYKRASTIYNSLMEERIWANEAGKKQVGQMLKKKQLLGLKKVSFGNLGDTAPKQDNDYVNFRAVGFSVWNDDDM